MPLIKYKGQTTNTITRPVGHDHRRTRARAPLRSASIFSSTSSRHSCLALSEGHAHAWPLAASSAQCAAVFMRPPIYSSNPTPHPHPTHTYAHPGRGMGYSFGCATTQEGGGGKPCLPCHACVHARSRAMQTCATNTHTGREGRGPTPDPRKYSAARTVTRAPRLSSALASQPAPRPPSGNGRCPTATVCCGTTAADPTPPSPQQTRQQGGQGRPSALRPRPATLRCPPPPPPHTRSGAMPPLRPAAAS